MSKPKKLFPRQLAAIRARHPASTQGEWEFEDAPANQFVNAVVKKAKANAWNDKLLRICALPGITCRTNDFKFIASAHQDIPALLAHIEFLQGELNK